MFPHWRQQPLPRIELSLAFHRITMKKTIQFIVLISIALAFSGCAFNAGYNPSYISSQPLALGAPGKALVVMESSDANWVFSGRPTSFTGGGTTLTVPLGEISKQVALKVFGAAFKDGTDFRNSVGDASNYRLVVSPKVATFTYAYNQLKNLGFAVTPQVNLQLRVTLISSDGKTLLEKTYTSGTVDGDSYLLSGQPAEKVNQLLHQVLFKLMTEAAIDAKGAVDEAPVVAMILVPSPDVIYAGQ